MRDAAFTKRRLLLCVLAFCLTTQWLTVAATSARAADKLVRDHAGVVENDHPVVQAWLKELRPATVVTIPWQAGHFSHFKMGSKEERGVRARSGTLSAELFRASGEGRAPYVVLLAGCGNTSEGANQLWLKLWARHLQDIGFGVLALDSLKGRGVHIICGRDSRTWAARRVDDAYSALAWLAARPDVDPRRIFIMGMSNGARTALLSIGATESWRPRYFAGAVAFYATCDRMPPHRPLAPSLLLMGEKDPVTKPPSCQNYAAERQTSPFAPDLVFYPEAMHLFDVYPINEDYNRPEVTDSRARALAFFKSIAGAPKS